MVIKAFLKVEMVIKALLFMDMLIKENHLLIKDNHHYH